MAKLNAQLTLGTSSDKHLYQTGVNLLFSAYDVAMYCHSHISKPLGSESERGLLAFFRLHGLRFFDGFVHRADHVESLFRHVVIVAVQDAFEAADRVFQRHILTWRTGKHFSNMERLRQEPLNLTGAGNNQLVVF